MTELAEPSFTAARTETLRRRVLVVGLIATAIIPINFFVFIDGGAADLKAFTVLALAQLALGIAAVITAVRYRMAAGRGGLVMAIAFGLVALGGPVGFVLVLVGLAMAGGMGGGAWGRPLRVRGRILHPELRLGSDWSAASRSSMSASHDAAISSGLANIPAERMAISTPMPARFANCASRRPSPCFAESSERLSARSFAYRTANSPVWIPRRRRSTSSASLSLRRSVP
jgi:hypothetical protein